MRGTRTDGFPVEESRTQFGSEFGCNLLVVCVRRVMSRGMCFQLECFPMLREETERIVTSHIRDRESRAKDQVTLLSV